MAAMRDIKLDNMCKFYKDVFSFTMRDETTGLFMDLLSGGFTKSINSFEEAFNYYTSVHCTDEEERLTNLDKRYSALTYFMIDPYSKLGKMTSKSMLQKLMSRYPLNMEYFNYFKSDEKDE